MAEAARDADDAAAAASALLPSYLREDPAAARAAQAQLLLQMMGLGPSQAQQLVALARALSRTDPAGGVGAPSAESFAGSGAGGDVMAQLDQAARVFLTCCRLAASQEDPRGPEAGGSKAMDSSSLFRPIPSSQRLARPALADTTSRPPTLGSPEPLSPSSSTPNLGALAAAPSQQELSAAAAGSDRMTAPPGGIRMSGGTMSISSFLQLPSGLAGAGAAADRGGGGGGGQQRRGGRPSGRQKIGSRSSLQISACTLQRSASSAQSLDSMLSFSALGADKAAAAGATGGEGG